MGLNLSDRDYQYHKVKAKDFKPGEKISRQFIRMNEKIIVQVCNKPQQYFITRQMNQLISVRFWNSVDDLWAHLSSEERKMSHLGKDANSTLDFRTEVVSSCMISIPSCSYLNRHDKLAV